MRNEFSDYEWTAIKPMLPNKPRGVWRVNDRSILRSRPVHALVETIPVRTTAPKLGGVDDEALNTDSFLGQVQA